MSVQRGDRCELLRVARHLNPPLLISPPPTPYSTHTKAPPRTAVNNTLEYDFWVRYIPSLVAAVGGNRPLDKLNRSWYNTRVEKNGNEQLQSSRTHQPRTDHDNSKDKTQWEPRAGNLTPQEPHDERRGTQRPQEKEISSETIPEEETQERECSTAAGQRPTQGYTGCAASRRELSSVIKKQIEQEKTWHFSGREYNGPCNNEKRLNPLVLGTGH